MHYTARVEAVGSIVECTFTQRQNVTTGLTRQITRESGSNVYEPGQRTKPAVDVL